MEVTSSFLLAGSVSKKAVSIMKSFLVIALPILLVAILASLGYMYKTGMFEGMFAQTETETETASPLPEKESNGDEAEKSRKSIKLSDVDSSTPEGLLQARDIVRASLETQKRNELERQQRESKETEKEKRLYESMDGWLKRTE